MLYCCIVVRFTNPSAEKAEVYALQEGIKNEILSYTPGDPSYCYCSNVDGKPDSETPQNGSSGGAGDGMSRIDESDTSDRRERAEQATDVPAVIGTREGYESLEDTQKQVSLAQSVKNLPSLTKAPGMRAAIVLTAGLMIFEQASGMIAILYYGGEALFCHRTSYIVQQGVPQAVGRYDTPWLTCCKVRGRTQKVPGVHLAVSPGGITLIQCVILECLCFVGRSSLNDAAFR